MCWSADIPLRGGSTCPFIILIAKVDKYFGAYFFSDGRVCRVRKVLKVRLESVCGCESLDRIS